MTDKKAGYHDQLVEEIQAMLDELETRGQLLLAPFITTAICNNHASGLAKNDDAEFWRHGGYSETRKQVTRCINDRRGDKPERKSEPWLPGFEYLQSYYVVDRNGDRVGVRTPDLTDQEIDEKAGQYRSMGAGCYAHADELDRYKEYRRTSEVG